MTAHDVHNTQRIGAKSRTTTQDKSNLHESNNYENRGKNVMGLKLAPLKVPWERRMETLAVLSWICTFLFMGPFFLILFIYLFLFTKYYYISIIYLAWYMYDRDICNRGGRRSDFVRRWLLWRRYCNFFPLRLVKTTELNPKQNYLFACHPHGVLCTGAFGNFATEGTKFDKVFPGITPHLLTLEGHYMFPLYREYLMLSGCCSASRSSMNYLLSHPDGGHVAVLVPGGPAESLDCRPGQSTKIHLRNRKGFIKIALQNGSPIVPCWSFGENLIYDQVYNPEGSRIRKVQETIRQIFGLAPVIFLGRGIFQYSFGILPQRRKITTVVGKPIVVKKISNPTQEEIDELHQRYMTGLLELFEQYKVLYADKNDTLEII